MDARDGVQGRVGEPGLDEYCGESTIDAAGGGMDGVCPMLDATEFWRGRKTGTRFGVDLVGDGFALFRITLALCSIMLRFNVSALDLVSSGRRQGLGIFANKGGGTIDLCFPYVWATFRMEGVFVLEVVVSGRAVTALRLYGSFETARATALGKEGFL